MNNTLFELIRDCYGYNSYADLFRKCGWDYKPSLYLTNNDSFVFKYYYDFIRDMGADLYIIDAHGVEFKADLTLDRTESLNQMLFSIKLKKKTIGDMWGISRASAWSRIDRAFFTMDDFVRMLALKGATMKICLDNGLIVYPEVKDNQVNWKRKYESETTYGMMDTEWGKIHYPALQYHGDFTGTYERERYWTDRSVMISTFSDEEAGIIKDLFMAEDGKLFFAVYDLATGDPIKVLGATRDDARLFIAGHGTV